VSKLKSASRAGTGVRGINLRPGDEICDMDVLTSDAISAANSSVSMRSAKKTKSDKALYLLAVTASGVGKRLLISEISPHGRNSKGVCVIKLNSANTKSDANMKSKSKSKKLRPDSLRCLRVCADSDNFVISTEQGVIAQQRVSDIGLQKRKSYGFLIQKVREGDSVAMVDVVKPNDDDGSFKGHSEELFDDVTNDKS
jgi:DNA gyrase/topoisomerase IV subunit A